MEKYLKQAEPAAPVLILLSFVSAILAAVGFAMGDGNDVWLNSTTWLVVASVLGVWAVYLKK